MTAPESVVRAVMDALGCRSSRGAKYCEAHPESDWLEIEDHCWLASDAADAGHAASLEWAAERVEGPSEIPLHASTCVYLASELRRWAWSK